jgi:hypothetical protein
MRPASGRYGRRPSELNAAYPFTGNVCKPDNASMSVPNLASHRAAPLLESSLATEDEPSVRVQQLDLDDLRSTIGRTRASQVVRTSEQI